MIVVYLLRILPFCIIIGFFWASMKFLYTLHEGANAGFLMLAIVLGLAMISLVPIIILMGTELEMKREMEAKKSKESRVE